MFLLYPKSVDETPIDILNKISGYDSSFRLDVFLPVSGNRQIYYYSFVWSLWLCMTYLLLFSPLHSQYLQVNTANLIQQYHIHVNMLQYIHLVIGLSTVTYSDSIYHNHIDALSHILFIGSCFIRHIGY